MPQPQSTDECFEACVEACVEALKTLDTYDLGVVLTEIRAHQRGGWPDRFTPVWFAIGNMVEDVVRHACRHSNPKPWEGALRCATCGATKQEGEPWIRGAL